jgi:septal ring factor EnvC (AmiA/AmiB activator)
MKKVVILISMVAASFVVLPSGLLAQLSTSPPTATPLPPKVLDEKTQKKVDQATEDIAKDQKSLDKYLANYEKDKSKLEKDKSKGKLSPDKISKAERSLSSLNKEIEKLRKKITQNQAFLDSFKKM